jgi:hypothetical protein
MARGRTERGREAQGGFEAHGQCPG